MWTARVSLVLVRTCSACAAVHKRPRPWCGRGYKRSGSLPPVDKQMVLQETSTDLLQSIHFDLQKVYKEAVVLIPLEDHEKNLTLLSLERRINGLINLIGDNLE